MFDNDEDEEEEALDCDDKVANDDVDDGKAASKADDDNLPPHFSDLGKIIIVRVVGSS